MLPVVSRSEVMSVGRKEPLQSLASNFPALLLNLWWVASIWAFFVPSRVSAKVSKYFFAACQSNLFQGSPWYIESVAPSRVWC